MEEFQKYTQTSTYLPYRPFSSGRSTTCVDCEKQHPPRRLVVCVDGTWYNANGSIVGPSDTSNIHRIWQLLPVEALVQDKYGRTWKQERMDYVPGVGIPTGLRYATTSVLAAITGDGDTGCSAKIKEVYKKCCSLCPSRDEIFMFGYSRGAFVVRSVAGMLHHIGALRISAADFDAQYDEALRVYHDLRNGSRKSNVIESFRTQHTRDSPVIRFVGVFDTVQAYNDSGLNDIRHLDNVYNVRHAMAMFERRAQFKLERFTNGTKFASSNRSCQEAWFVGTHGNLGGACKEDGLALWPLQWILSEAQNFGLALRFTATSGSSTKNPAHLIFPWLRNSTSSIVPTVHDQMIHVSYSNGISASFCDLSDTFQKPGFRPELNAGPKLWVGFAERQIFKKDGSLIDTANSPYKSSGVIIHPSVYWMDSKRSDIIRAINIFPCSQQLRDSVSTITESDQLHWNMTEEISQIRRPAKPRILVCGYSGVGKSSLINAVLDREVTNVSIGAESGEHDINMPLGREDDPLVLHDSQGWQSGEEVNFPKIEQFLQERRKAHLIQDQLHCVWFCSSSTQERITQTDINFLNLDFGQVPVIIVTTKQDLLEGNVESRILSTEYRSYRKGNRELLPPGIREKASARIEEEVQRTMDNIKRQWLRHTENGNRLKPTFQFFSERFPWVDDSIPALQLASEQAMTSERIRQIHCEAQKYWIDNALNEAIEELVTYWGDNRKTLELVESEDPIKDFVKKAIEKVNNVFQYNNFDEKRHPDYIMNLLHYSKEENGIWSLIYSGLKGVLGTIALFNGPYTVTVAAGTYGFSAATNARKRALSFIPEMLHVLLIFERIYWYHGGEINDLFIQGSCCYYLKIQARVIQRAKEIQGWDMFGAQLKTAWEMNVVRDVLKNTVNEFRFKHSRVDHPTTGAEALKSMPGAYSAIGGGL